MMGAMALNYTESEVRKETGSIQKHARNEQQLRGSRDMYTSEVSSD